MDLTLRTDRCEVLPCPVERAWAHLARPDRYGDWWPWLRHPHLTRLATGERWAAQVASPLPLRLRLTVDLVEVAGPHLVVAVVSGDLAGPARLDLAPGASGCTLRLRSELVPRRPALRLLTAAARPLARRSHDHVLTRGIGQLRSVLAAG